MTRFMPPHLLIPSILFIALLWVMLVRHFRWSVASQRFVAEILGDDTPENALLTFEMARRRLIHHLKSNNLDDRTRQRIELALDITDRQTLDAHTDDHSV